ncbi:Iota-carrageenase [Gossypium australe]|uniref:Iota-carrageenase n=1 Tax=Gossypium australe TaxID=47621 RepID=A0A5B6UWJ2_9ROSI|nr:Iota-carrageenase [Gossypium australe]
MEASGTESKGKAIGELKRSGFAIPTPKFKRRAELAIRDFPPGCGPSFGADDQEALIDIGSTHSYVSSTVSGTLSIESEVASREMTVISPLGQSVVVNKLFRNVS